MGASEVIESYHMVTGFPREWPRLELLSYHESQRVDTLGMKMLMEVLKFLGEMYVCFNCGDANARAL